MNHADHDDLDLLHTAVDLAIDEAAGRMGARSALIVPLVKKGVELLMRLLRKRAHKDTLRQLDELLTTIPEKL